MTRCDATGKMTQAKRGFQWLTMAAGVLALAGCALPNEELRDRASTALFQHDIARADRLLTQAVEQKPTDWEAQFMLGKIRLEEGKYAQAQLLLEQALALHGEQSQTPEILDALAEAMYRQGDRAGLAGFLKQTASERQRPRDFIRQAWYLSKIGDPDGAALALKKAAAMAGKNNPYPYLEMADFYTEVNDTDNAILALRRAYTISPHNPQIAARLRQLGVVPGPTTLLPPEE
jgi:tetratricopeptide (TPR) repeat protein